MKNYEWYKADICVPSTDRSVLVITENEGAYIAEYRRAFNAFILCQPDINSDEFTLSDVEFWGDIPKPHNNNCW